MRVFQEVQSGWPEGLLTIESGLPIDDPAALEGAIDRFMAENGYTTHDVVELSSATPDEALARFDRPHTHSEDEVRLFLDGEGIFDLRDDGGSWYRFLLEKGDMIVIPAGRVHRFEPTYTKALRCVRIFRDEAGWVPHYE